jgi:RHH-type proline utilization regulon transcriptional repressor/proline dehydrogenase/delta 1-pyrroline-5-carboxylate dehydrogenase
MQAQSPTGPDEAEILSLGRALAAALPRPSRAPGAVLDRTLMRTAAEDDGLRSALFRFVDVRPACHGRRDVGDHLVALLRDGDAQGRAGVTLTRLASRRRSRPAMGALAGVGVHRMARRFIIGESVGGAAGTLSGLWAGGVASSVDLLGEATVSESEADAYAARCLDSLEALTALAGRWPERPAFEADSLGPIPRVNLSVKITALTPHIRPSAPERGIESALARLRGLLRRARDLGAHLHVDMESLDSRETVLGLTLSLLAEPEFRDGPSAGLVLQAYLRDSPEELSQILSWVDEHPRGWPLTIRLVKGAYWDHEVVEARQHGWAVPVFEQRADSDRNFEALTRRALAAHPRVRLALGSHNLRSIAHGLACLPHFGLADSDLELQVLRGLGDDLGEALSARGLRVRSYCPIGDLVEGMAYLVRRMLENTANDSFLRARDSGVDLDELLAAP